MEKRIILFGASTMSGFWDEEGGWYSRLREKLRSYQLENEINEFQLYNCSISGDDSEGLRKRIQTELEARYMEDKEIITLISIGGNDALYFTEEDRNNIQLEEFRKNLSLILEVAERFSDRVIFVSGTPNDPDRSNPLEWDESLAYRPEDIENYDELKKELCSKRDIPYMDLMDKLGENWSEKLQDGVHPNTEGHRQIEQIIGKELQQMEVIPEIF